MEELNLPVVEASVPKTRQAKRDPLVNPSMRASEVKRRTGFSSSLDLIAYVVTICNGDLELIRHRNSSLTWYEEWFLFFEFSYGHTAVRRIDMEATWKLHHFHINRILDSKLAIEIGALQSWPPYATLREDMLLRNKEKWDQYDDQRVVMWDMTNITAVMYENSVGQRQCYSEYYGILCLERRVPLES